METGEIAAVFGKDAVKRVIQETTSSLADSLVSKALQWGEMIQKSFVELQSGRIVEVVTLANGQQKCISTFTNYLDPKELIQKIQDHHFLRDGPLLLTSGFQAHVIYADEGGQIHLIDPHNMQRSPIYSSHRYIKEYRSGQRFFISFFLRIIHHFI